MLKIHFGSLKSEIHAVDDVFFIEQEYDWFLDPFVQQMLYDIDEITVLPNGALTHPTLGYVRVEDISMGVKNLILAYKLNRVIDASYCGDNCAKWILKIADLKDLKITLCHIMVFPKDVPFHCYITNNSKHVYSLKDYAREAVRFLFSGKN